MNKQDIVKILSIIVFILALVFLFVSVKFPQSECSKCSYDYDGETLSTKEFFKIYSSVCLSDKINIENINYTNILLEQEANG